MSARLAALLPPLQPTDHRSPLRWLKELKERDPVRFWLWVFGLGDP